MKYWVLGLVLCFVFLPCFLQSQLVIHKKDALVAAFQSKPTLTGGIDSRNSFITGRQIALIGVKGGLDFDNVIRLGVGFYTLFSTYRSTLFLSGDTTLAKLKFYYFSVYGEYILLNTKKWSLAFPLHLGIGNTFFKEVKDATQQAVLLAEISVDGEYKIVPWLGIGAAIGYRQMILKNRKIPSKMSSPMYVIKVQLHFKELLETFKRNKHMLKKIKFKRE